MPSSAPVPIRYDFVNNAAEAAAVHPKSRGKRIASMTTRNEKFPQLKLKVYTPMNSALRSLFRVFGRGIVSALGLTAWTVTADIAVNMTATPLGGGLSQYEFSIANTGPEDVPIVSITDAPVDDPFIGVTLEAPPGFLALYDPGIGLTFGFVDFLEDTALFAAGTTTSGFRFQSAAGPPDYLTRFEALTVNGVFLSGNINLRATVPDTGSTWLMATAGFLALVCFRRAL
jgi:hypothetical protein